MLCQSRIVRRLVQLFVYNNKISCFVSFLLIKVSLEVVLVWWVQRCSDFLRLDNEGFSWDFLFVDLCLFGELHILKTNKKKLELYFSFLFFSFFASYQDVPRRYPNVESDSFVVPLQTSFWHVDIHIWIVPGQLIPHSTFFCLPWENVLGKLVSLASLHPDL